MLIMEIRRIIFCLVTFSFLACSSDDEQPENVNLSDTAHLYATSHSGTVKKFDINTGAKTTYNTSSSDAEGIYYNDASDSFIIVSRAPSQIQEYEGISDLAARKSHNISTVFTGNSDLESPRDLAVSNDFYVVSDNADVDGNEETPEGRFFIYQRTDNGFSLRNVVITRFKIWGIEFVNDDLYVIKDFSNEVAVFRNFINLYKNFNIAAPNKTIALEGIVRGHGLDFENGTMIVSDIGEEVVDTDGALHIIKDFTSKFENTPAEGLLPISEQLRISGTKTLLGDPVAVVYDANYNAVFVAEAANGGGRVLGFRDIRTASGNISPVVNYVFQGASGLHFFTDKNQ